MSEQYCSDCGKVTGGWGGPSAADARPICVHSSYSRNEANKFMAVLYKQGIHDIEPCPFCGCKMRAVTGQVRGDPDHDPECPFYAKYEIAWVKIEQWNRRARHEREEATVADILAWLKDRPGISWVATIKDIEKALAALTPATPAKVIPSEAVQLAKDVRERAEKARIEDCSGEIDFNDDEPTEYRCRKCGRKIPAENLTGNGHYGWTEDGECVVCPGPVVAVEPPAPKEKRWRCQGCGRRNIPESALSDDKTRHAVVVGQLGFGEMDVDFCGPVIVEEPDAPGAGK